MLNTYYQHRIIYFYCHIFASLSPSQNLLTISQVLSPTYKQRNEDFRKLFKQLPDTERLIVGEWKEQISFSINNYNVGSVLLISQETEVLLTGPGYQLWSWCQVTVSPEFCLFAQLYELVLSFNICAGGLVRVRVRKSCKLSLGQIQGIHSYSLDKFCISPLYFLPLWYHLMQWFPTLYLEIYPKGALDGYGNIFVPNRHYCHFGSTKKGEKAIERSLWLLTDYIFIWINSRHQSLTFWILSPQTTHVPCRETSSYRVASTSPKTGFASTATSSAGKHWCLFLCLIW